MNYYRKLEFVSCIALILMNILYFQFDWDGKTHVCAASASRLDNVKWKVIFHAIVEKVGWLADDKEVEEGNGRCSTRVF